METTFNVLSFNCWGLKHVSKHREKRLRAIAHHLGAHGVDYDIIALQEIWVEEDYYFLQSNVKKHLPYSKFYYSGILSGPGLAVFSRWPIVSASLHRFPINGRPSAFFRGDWYVGKAVASAVIVHPSGNKIEVLNAHLHAPYGPGDASYNCHRTAQAWDMARIAQRAIASGHFVLAMGDLNSVPDSLTYRLFQSVGELSDSWLDKHGVCTAAVETLSLIDQVKLAGVTCDSQLNTWREKRDIREAKRLDYIFYDRTRGEVLDSRVSCMEKIPGVGSFSDHFALESRFQLRPKQVISETAKPEPLRQLYTDILTLISEYRPTAVSQKHWRLVHFWISIAALVGICIGVFWGASDNRGYVGFILVFATILIAVTGLIDGIIGFLFGRNELRALLEFESEVSLSRSFL